MAESVRITNLPDNGAPARVAFDLMTYLHRAGVQTPEGKDKRGFMLDLYAECLDAANDRRKSA